MNKLIRVLAFIVSLHSHPVLYAQKSGKDSLDVKAEHGGINIVLKQAQNTHTSAPDAQWFANAGFGLFLHWGISSVKAINISWSMIPGRKLANMAIAKKEQERIFREKDFNLDGKVPQPTPNEYFLLAKDFDPKDYDVEKWIKAAKHAGFTYAVLTTKHHEGFAMWPSKYGGFNTENYIAGRDLVAPFVKACKKYGLRVGLYYSPPDWYFERDYKNFLDFQTVAAHPDFSALDANLDARKNSTVDPEKLKKYQRDYAAMVKGQVIELLTRYGKIDLLWFDGKPAIPGAENIITTEEIRNIQPGIVINPRLHGIGDYKTFERVIPEERSYADTGWAEFCNTWTGFWAYDKNGIFRANGYILGQLVKCRAMGINYLLGIGPMANGKLEENAYTNMVQVSNWMTKNKQAVIGVKRIDKTESSSVPATTLGNKRYLYLIPEYTQPFKENQLPLKEVVISYRGKKQPKTVKLLALKTPLDYTYHNEEVKIKVPVALRSDLVDVVEITF